ncbi:methylmalonyl-CoA mutase family protein [Vulgatibacter incomptus]|uniref:Methylmalonyl-CoA mutase n=1 Tax=Vulgatibacter incomptus TaxID=1391653 RepID=A0A0K1P9I0_9BACT|nr:methylmalonyl-CoA mutase family protein [Vulgatibacter incomptus]AKU89744.1 Methylmalonyl-CoA mutase [Vulgatibacter incomptus]
MTEDSRRLLPDPGPFPDSAAWREQVEEGLEGAPFEKKLVTRLEEGLAIQPLYTRADLPAGTDPAGFPGFAPLVRGSSPVADRGGWRIRAAIDAADPRVAKRLVAREIERGASAVTLEMDAAFRKGLSPADPGAEPHLGEGGVHVTTAEDLAELLPDGHVSVDAGGQALPAAATLAAAWEARGVAPAEARGSFDADPLGVLAREGTLPVSLDDALLQLGELAAWTVSRFPGVTSTLVSTAPYHDAGATADLELAAAMSTGAAYLRALEAGGLSLEAASAQIVFRFQVGVDVFLEIAKLRAARRLWCRILEASGVREPSMALEAETAWRNLAARDPWVNMLRTTIGAFASASGGAQAVLVRPFDEAIGPSDDFARRIARNTQLILRDESQLHRVEDPAGGSFYLERLTEELAVAAWAKLQALEAEGGIAAALASGSLRQQLEATRAKRSEGIARRKTPITGVNEFPNLHEAPVSRPVPDLAALRSEWTKRAPKVDGARPEGASRLDTAVALAAKGAGVSALAARFATDAPPASIPPLRFERLSEPFERLRDRSDAHLARTGARPKVFLANLGPVAKHVARATFADNFFAAGGIETLGNEGFASADAAAEALRANGAKVAVICGTDAAYAEQVSALGPALRAAGAERILLAGRPGESEAVFRASGVDDFVFVGVDLLEKLSSTLDALGVAPAPQVKP